MTWTCWWVGLQRSHLLFFASHFSLRLQYSAKYCERAVRRDVKKEAFISYGFLKHAIIHGGFEDISDSFPFQSAGQGRPNNTSHRAEYILYTNVHSLNTWIPKHMQSPYLGTSKYTLIAFILKNMPVHILYTHIHTDTIVNVMRAQSLWD